ncbi:pyridoxal phosphate-dependent aminotransferase [Geopsychrobacter electrodiphilus]|uniref:pyridoxal phosphate-dependent aminotransferase n=1 Tax=Geopsychrobacter electrodiphilus TaxID=225196 RepID=UPI00037F30DE|nr:pyridoxal phosphate-dependent aminotransferase [Geopsychrobacter electrodiphilus]
MQIPLSRRAQLVTPFLAMEVMEKAKALEATGRDIIYLCLGEPDFPTPPAVVAATRQALEDGATSYTHSLGLLELRTEIARYYHQRYGVRIEPEQVLVSNGTSPLMLLLFSLLLEEGDELILPDPGYACYPNFVRFAGGNPVALRTDPANGFQPRPAEVQAVISPRSRGLLINSPSNPAGSVLGGAELQALARLPIPIISDEIYHGLTYEGDEHSILEYTNNAFVLGGFSKAYAMTGWRLGYLISPPGCVRALQALHQNFMICANHFVQLGGVAALRYCSADVERMRRLYDLRRRQLVRQLRDLGFGIPFMPKGAFYVLADARHIDTDSMRLALDILDKTGVALTPGIDFGEGAEGFLRFSYSSPLEKIDDAMQRLTLYLRDRGKLPPR